MIKKVDIIFIFLLLIILSVYIQSIHCKSAGAENELNFQRTVKDQSGNVFHDKNVFFTDTVKVDHTNKNQLKKLFKNMYIKKGLRTDCSFVSAFMLMVSHDPDYPYKIMSTNNDGSYDVKFPGYNYKVKVTSEDLKKFYSTIESKRTWKTVLVKGYAPPGLEILRCAYYDYQRKTGQRAPQYNVYGGGVPIKDMMILSGAKKGGKIIAYKSYNNIPDELKSFSNSMERQIEVVARNGLFKAGYTEAARELNNPLDHLGKLSDYIIILCSVKKTGKLDSLFGIKIISNHAYYFIEMSSDSGYILGNSYNTKEHIILEENELLKKFNSIHFVKIKESSPD